MGLTVYEISKKAKEYAREYWGLEYNVPISVNSRLTRALGRYKWKRVGSKYRPVAIELSKNLLSSYSDETIISVLKHELCHWALQQTDQPFSDGHPVFENELKRIGADSTNTIQPAGKLNIVNCSKCNKEAVRKSGSVMKYIKPQSRYRSRCCNEKLVSNGYVYIEDKNGEQVEIRREERERTTSHVAATQTALVTLDVEKQPNSRLDKIIKPGKRGVTNAQMIPTIRKVIDEGTLQDIELLKKEYPDVFENSFKYLPKTYQLALQQMLG